MEWLVVGLMVGATTGAVAMIALSNVRARRQFEILDKALELARSVIGGNPDIAAAERLIVAIVAETER